MMKRRRKKSKSAHDDGRDPIADYREWTNNRYVPGYYTGGRLSPFMRGMQKLFSPTEKRVLLAILIVVVAGMVAMKIWRAL